MTQPLTLIKKNSMPHATNNPTSGDDDWDGDFARRQRFHQVLYRVDADGRKIPIMYESFAASSGWLHIAISFWMFLQNLVENLKNSQKCSGSSQKSFGNDRFTVGAPNV